MILTYYSNIAAGLQKSLNDLKNIVQNGSFESTVAKLKSLFLKRGKQEDNQSFCTTVKNWKL